MTPPLKRYASTALALALLVCLPACGDDDEAAGGPAANSAPANNSDVMGDNNVNSTNGDNSGGNNGQENSGGNNGNNGNNAANNGANNSGNNANNGANNANNGANNATNNTNNVNNANNAANNANNAVTNNDTNNNTNNNNANNNANNNNANNNPGDGWDLTIQGTGWSGHDRKTVYVALEDTVDGSIDVMDNAIIESSSFSFTWPGVFATGNFGYKLHFFIDTTRSGTCGNGNQSFTAIIVNDFMPPILAEVTPESSNRTAAACDAFNGQ